MLPLKSGEETCGRDFNINIKQISSWIFVYTDFRQDTHESKIGFSTVKFKSRIKIIVKGVLVFLAK